VAVRPVEARDQGARLVVVDDEAVISDILRRRLAGDGYDVATAGSAEEARALILRGGAEALLADIQMPRESGLDLLAWARRHDPDLAVIMVTAVATLSTAVEALRSGAADYILKPFNLDQVSFAVRRALDRRQVVVRNRAYRERLEAMVGEKTRAHAAALAEIQATYAATLKALGAALSYREGSSPSHSDRVAAISLAIGARLRLAGADLDALERAALLHDIGKISIPDAVLARTEGHTPGETALLRDHPRKGHELLARIAFLRPAAAIVYAQAERWDGRGYPRGLVGEAIPMGARVFAVANAYDLLTAGRGRLDAASARARLREGAGREFDPRVVEAFLALPADLIPDAE
jgi:response regulator RpfG family c-di-GMP phosphodiesterase